MQAGDALAVEPDVVVVAAAVDVGALAGCGEEVAVVVGVVGVAADVVIGVEGDAVVGADVEDFDAAVELFDAAFAFVLLSLSLFRDFLLFTNLLTRSDPEHSVY